MNDLDKQVFETAAAGLLHDVGKILQRARVSLSSQAERMEQILCPSDQHGRATRRHSLWTNDFLETYLPNSLVELDRSAIIQLASHHHQPSTPQEWVIAEADRLASGHDRREGQSAPANFRRVCLQSICSRMQLSGSAETAKPLAWLPRPLNARQIIPADSVDGGEVERAWAPLAEGMAAWFQQAKLADLSPTLLLQALIGFSWRFQSLTPASAINVPDVSLHDHASITGAIAAAMLRHHAVSGTIEQSAVCDRAQVKYRFIIGSLGGIQDFIFTLDEAQRRRIAKAYRARSFYISALTEAVTLRLLEAAGLPSCNCILNAGGRFVLFVDSSRQTLDSLHAAGRELQRWFVREHLGVLRLQLDCDLTCAGQDLLGESFGQLYRRIENHAERAKLSSLASCLRLKDSWLSAEFLRRGDNPRELQERRLSDFERLGRAITQTSSMGFYSRDADPAGLLQPPLDCCGYRLQLGTATDRLPLLGAHSQAWLDEDADPDDIRLPHRPIANYVPILSGEDVATLSWIRPTREADRLNEDYVEPREGLPATFEHIAHFSQMIDRDRDDHVRGQPMLACLKADVDRLGLLFSKGFGADASFARVAWFSRLLDLFFKGHLTSQLRIRFRHTYTVFAGGDDLMLIGPWHQMLDLAEELRRWFDELTGGNSDITLSAAIVFGHAKMPPSHMARAADALLEEAKDAGRNRVGILGRVLSWEGFRAGLDIGRRLDGMAAGGRMPIRGAFLYRLLQHARSAERVSRSVTGGGAVTLADLTYRSHLLYDIRRNIEARNSGPERIPEEDVEWLRSLLPAQSGGDFAHVILGCTYALYRTRGEK